MRNEDENFKLNQNQEEETEEEEEKERGGNSSGGPKISLLELLLWPLPAAILADIVDLVSWSGVGTIISWALDILSGGSLALWLFLKGLRGEYMILAGVLDMIPIVDILPFKTILLLILYYQQKNPKTLGLAGKALEVVGKIKSSK